MVKSMSTNFAQSFYLGYADHIRDNLIGLGGAWEFVLVLKYFLESPALRNVEIL